MRWEPTPEEEKKAIVVFFWLSCLSMPFFAYMAARSLAAGSTENTLLAIAFFAWGGFWAVYHKLDMEDAARQSTLQALPKLVFD